jgi:hypothetical protein
MVYHLIFADRAELASSLGLSQTQVGLYEVLAKLLMCIAGSASR